MNSHSVDAEAGLRRRIRLPQATALVAGTIIGASIFVQPAEISRVGSIGGVLGIWLLAGLLTLVGALVSAELASLFPQSGGLYVFLRESFSPLLGFLWGWAMFWSVHSGIIAAIAVVFSRYLAYFLPLGEAGLKAGAVGAIALLTAVNVAGVGRGAALQTLFTAGKVGAILLMTAAAFLLGRSLPAHFVSSSAAADLGGWLAALVAGLFAFGGWHMVTYNAEETVRPRRTIPRALVLGTLLVTFCYLALNAAYLYLLPLERVARSRRIAAEAADLLLPGWGGGLMSGLVLFSTFGALAGIILAGPRVYYAMARDGLLFGWLGAIHPRHGTPHRALWLQAFWSSVLVLTGSYRILFTRVIYTEWIFFGLMTLGLFRLRRRGLVGRYRMWGYPVLPALFAAACFGIVAAQLAAHTSESLTGLALVVAGLPVYYVWATGRKA